jgi:membrane-associated protease RseP (regulator of RpoE activity)
MTETLTDQPAFVPVPARWTLLPPPLPSPWIGAWRNAVLLVLTIASVYWVGVTQYPMGWVGGVRLVVAVIAIMLTHEMGHYLACRYYGVDATLPFFIPFPFHMVGTFGAFIRIRSPFPDRRVLFDVGIAGPLAGFAVCLPVLALGILEARVVPETITGGLMLGEPLVFQWATALLRGDVPAGATLAIGPVGMAAWFGLLMTALNLMPIGQLDGGHVVYALFRRRAALVSRIALAVSVILVYLRPSWLIWFALLLVLSRPHPPTLHDARPAGRGRIVVGLIGLAVFIVSFTPEPIMISWADFLQAWWEIL